VRNQIWGFEAEVMVLLVAVTAGRRLLVAVVQSVDVAGIDRLRGTELVCDVDGPGDIFDQHGGLHRRPRVDTDGERPVIAHQDRTRAVRLQGFDDAAPDGVVADQLERPDRDRAAELVGDHREDARNRHAPRSPRRRVRRMSVDDPADLGHVPVNVSVRGGVGGRREITVDQLACQVRDDHGLRGISW
jgi:hypothetical protein